MFWNIGIIEKEKFIKQSDLNIWNVRNFPSI